MGPQVAYGKETEVAKTRRTPYLLAGATALVIVLLLSPICAPLGEFEPLLFGLPYTVVIWFAGSVVVAALCIYLGFWGLGITKKGGE